MTKSRKQLLEDLADAAIKLDEGKFDARHDYQNALQDLKEYDESKEELVLKNIWITYEEGSNRNEDRYGDGDWDYTWSENHHYHSYRAFVNKVPFGEEIQCVGVVQPELGDTIGVVIIKYSAGDSFGRSSGNESILWAGDPKLAGKVQDQIKTWVDDYNNQESHSYSSESMQITLPGIERPVYMGSYVGYFERVEEIRVEVLSLGKK